MSQASSAVATVVEDVPPPLMIRTRSAPGWPTSTHARSTTASEISFLVARIRLAYRPVVTRPSLARSTVLREW
jgi:hypothetical protein